MDRRMIKRYNNNNGFTLIELIIAIVIIGILAVVAVPKVGNYIDAARVESTKGEMLTLKEALDGEDGYKVTVGDNLYDNDLTYLVTKPASVSTYNTLTGLGWNGPYIIDDGSDDYKEDAWGNAYVVTATTITSNGLDEAAGTADDIVLNY